MNRGWALTLGVFLGYQVARLQDKMPFIVDSVVRIRSMVEHAVFVPGDTDDDDEDDGEGDDA